MQMESKKHKEVPFTTRNGGLAPQEGQPARSSLHLGYDDGKELIDKADASLGSDHLDHANAVGDVEGIVIRGQAHVRLLLAIGSA